MEISTSNKKCKWQIWTSEDGCEQSTLPEVHPQHEFLTQDGSGKKMKLVHEYFIEGDDPFDYDVVTKAFEYSEKWRFGDDQL